MQASGSIRAERALSIGLKPLAKAYFAKQLGANHLPAVTVAWEHRAIDPSTAKTPTAPGLFDQWYLKTTPAFVIPDAILRVTQPAQGQAPAQAWECSVGRANYAAYGKFT